MSSIKVIVLVGLIIFGIVLDLGGGPTHDRIGFRYWKNPGPFAHYIQNNTKTGAFLGAWYAFPNALFAYIGTELVGVTVGECANPRKQVPRAIKSTFWRILVFYVGGIFVVGLLVPSNSQLRESGSRVVVRPRPSLTSPTPTLPPYTSQLSPLPRLLRTLLRRPSSLRSR